MARVVITGMGAVTPIGNTANEMWQSMLQGRHGIAPITHFDTTDFAAKLAAEVKGYDASQYISKKDMARCDPYAQFGIGAASMAIEQSGIIGHVRPDRIGVYFSSGVGGLTTIENSERALLQKGSTRVPSFSVPTMISNSASAMIAIKYDCCGANIAMTSACASSTNAIGEAYRAIKHGYADAILAGGADATINPIGVASFLSCRALSKSEIPDRASIPFDAERAGFVMGEGGGALLLEEYEHAKNRGAVIFAEVCGYGTTCDAYHITRPNPEAENAALAIHQAIDQSGMNTNQIYINAHGTSTVLNDATETRAIKKALGKERAHKIYVSSTKGTMGHLLGGAGAVESIAAIMALNEDAIPPTVGYRVKDDACDLNICPNEKQHAPIDLALSNSLGFGGHNACIAFKKV